jgi:hypothetical protein
MGFINPTAASPIPYDWLGWRRGADRRQRGAVGNAQPIHRRDSSQTFNPWAYVSVRLKVFAGS